MLPSSMRLKKCVFGFKMPDNFSPNQVNNAGCMVLERELTEDGLERNFVTNTLGRPSPAEVGHGESKHAVEDIWYIILSSCLCTVCPNHIHVQGERESGVLQERRVHLSEPQ